jgi:hypothetical protein
MKKKHILTLLFTVVITLFSFATQQTPDLLIVGKDTFYLKSFPIDKLNFKENMNPFDTGLFVSTNCWRGYIATWELKDNKLFLQKVQKCNTDSIIDYNKVISYFETNGYKANIINGKIFADWYSAKLFKCELYDCKGRKNHLQEINKIKKKHELVFTFMNGELLKKE